MLDKIEQVRCMEKKKMLPLKELARPETVYYDLGTAPAFAELKFSVKKHTWKTSVTILQSFGDSRTPNEPPIKNLFCIHAFVEKVARDLIVFPDED